MRVTMRTKLSDVKKAVHMKAGKKGSRPVAEMRYSKLQNMVPCFCVDVL